QMVRRRPSPCLARLLCPLVARVFAPAPQRNFRQAPAPRPAPPLPCCENRPRHPPYPLLVMAPVHTLPGVTIECGQALRSVHRGVQRALRCWHRAAFCPKAHLPTSAPFRARAATGPASGPVIQRPPGRRPRVLRPLLSCCLSAARHPLLGHPNPAREFRPPHGRPTAPPAHTRACDTDPDRVSTFRTRETRTGPGALSTPGTTVPCWPSPHPWPPPAAFQRPVPIIPAQLPSPGCDRDEASARVSW